MTAFFAAVLCLTFTVSCPVFADEVVKQIICNGYKTTLTYDTDKFFSGTFSVKDNEGTVVFYDDGFYSSCYFDTLADIDGNGISELIAGLSTGASPYLWSELFVIDLSGDSMKIFSVTNGELKYSPEGGAYISSTVRLSPAYLGALYKYPVVIRYGRMYVPVDDELVKYSKGMDIDESYYQEAILNYENEIDECLNRQDYLTLFEAYLITSAFSGRRGFAEEFLRKTYKCDDVQDALIEARQYSDSVIGTLMKEDFVYRKD
ncbi:MAG: hypothetical protein K1X85_04045 [Ignavibacteria bacterium]|nr:hypothetical protein [Ignavibacteria bacterium]